MVMTSKTAQAKNSGSKGCSTAKERASSVKEHELTPSKTTESQKNLCSCSSKAKKASRLQVHYDAGFGNALFLRGEGAGLNWDKGIQLKNEGPTSWYWETDSLFDAIECKVVLNDQQYELGPNHRLLHGEWLDYAPSFG